MHEYLKKAHTWAIAAEDQMQGNPNYVAAQTSAQISLVWLKLYEAERNNYEN